MEEYDKFLMWNMTWPEIEKNLKINDIVLVSISSTEQHGRHCPISTDAVIGLEVCKRTLKKFYESTGQHALLAATLNIGMSLHHMNFPGTLTLQPKTLMNVVRDVCISLIQHGFKKIIVVNSHGGNRTILDAALRYVKTATEGQNLFICWVEQEIFGREKWNEICESGARGTAHAGEKETSIMMTLGQKVRIDEIPKTPKVPNYLFPEFTRRRPSKGVKYPGGVKWVWNTNELSKDGYIGDPTKATAEKGDKIIEIISDVFVEFLKNVNNLKL